jgi:hypothetical protein
MYEFIKAHPDCTREDIMSSVEGEKSTFYKRRLALMKLDRVTHWRDGMGNVRYRVVE